MRILVCIKNVPDPQLNLRIDDKNKRLEIVGTPRYQINPYDEYALEEALRIKDLAGEAEIDLVTVGPDHCESALRRGLSMGADNGIHLVCNSELIDQGWFVAQAIAGRLHLYEYDLILTGVMSQDLCQGQVGPMIAGIIGIPVIVSIIDLSVNLSSREITVTKELEQGAKSSITLQLPALLTVQTSRSQPRYPTLSNTLRAKNQPLELIPLDNGPVNGDYPLEITRIAEIKSSRSKENLQGPLTEKVERLRVILKDKGFL